MNVSLRDNLLVTAGSRAADMHELGKIDLPSGVDGEDELAAFVVSAVDVYIVASKTKEINFDEYIEACLTKQYG